jgi:tRNA dimethylallyltransferase
MSPFGNALILTGPTACGKTALALDLAERLGAEIVALDSMTVYRGMDIGTAKPTAAERARVPHHLIDVLDPWESLTVAWWLENAKAACRDITARGKRPLFVGGTPFYLKALLHGLFPGPPGDEELRHALELEAATLGVAALHARLAAIDAKTAARLHPNDVRRVVRALEVHTITGKPISEWQGTWDTPAFAADPSAAPPPIRIPAVVLELPREELYSRINQRVDGMLAAGWLDEVRRLLALPRPLSREARQALGYRELLAYLGASAGLTQQNANEAAQHLPSPPQSRGRGEEGRPGWEEAVELIRTHTRQFAKRQLTWFRHLPQLVPVPGDAPDRGERVLIAWGETSGRGEIDTLA